MKKRYIVSYLILAALLCALFILNVCSGSVKFTPTEVWENLVQRGAIIWNIRLPRVIAVVVLGGALSVAGFLLQTFFANPIAGPFVLGISSGAKLTVALMMIFFLGQGMLFGSAAMIGAAFIGAMLSMALVLAFSRKVRRSAALIVAGVMVGYICNAITDFVVTFADESNIVNLHYWSLGSFSGMTWENIRVMCLVIIPALIFTFMLSKPIGAYQMGEVYAQNMGVKIKLFRAELVLLSSVLSACVTAFAGPISFVGVAVPHITKGLFKTAKPIVIIPACFLGGAVFCLFCDLIARIAFAPTELNISSVTAILGAPIVISIMLRRKGGQE